MSEQAGTRTPRRRRFTVVTALVVASGLSTFGSGLVYPYTAIYLAAKHDIGVGGAATYYGVSAGFNLAVAIVLTLGWMRLPQVALGVLGNALSLVGFTLMSGVHSVPVLVVAAAAVGAGQGCYLAAVIPIMNRLVGEADRRDVFARRYRAINVGLALGSLVAGVTVGVLASAVIPYLFLLNAVSYIPIGITLLSSRKHLRTGSPSGATPCQPASSASRRERPAAGRPALLSLLSRVGIVVLFQLGVYLFGHSQFEATTPLVASQLMRTGLASVSVLLIVNTLVVVFAQHTMTRLLKRREEIYGLKVSTLLWAGAFVLVTLASLGPPPVRIAGLVLFAAVFALGECAYSCSYHPWLIASTAEADLTRASALSNAAMGVGMAAGPTLGVALLHSGSAAVVFSLLCACCVGMTLLARRPRTASQENIGTTIGTSTTEAR